jgi:voltage-gated potassium channel Kch
MLVVRLVLALVGLLLVIAVLHDAFEVMLLPRRIKTKTRIVRYFFAATWAFWSAIGRHLDAGERRSNFLALYGPLSIVLILAIWAVGLVIGFSGVFTSLEVPQLSFENWFGQAYLSGVTFFTLGYGDTVPHSPVAKILSVAEAGTGLGFIAAVIGYLPVIYQLFSRRESQVLTLDAIAGSPPSPVTVISRFAESGNAHALDSFLLRWQLWCAELLESQLSYPMLAYYRSQHDNQSWLAALTVMLDTCAIILVGLGPLPTFQARLTFATARLALIEMGRVLAVRPHSLAEDRLPPALFGEMIQAFEKAGLAFVEEDAEARLRAFRDTYEGFLNGLARHLLLPLPAWLSDPGQLDNWVNSPRGRSAKRLIDSMEVKSPDSDVPPLV